MVYSNYMLLPIRYDYNNHTFLSNWNSIMVTFHGLISLWNMFFCIEGTMMIYLHQTKFVSLKVIVKVVIKSNRWVRTLLYAIYSIHLFVHVLGIYFLFQHLSRSKKEKKELSESLFIYEGIGILYLYGIQWNLKSIHV